MRAAGCREYGEFMTSVTVFGAGSWGTAIACLLARGGHRVRLWGRDPTRVDQIRQTRINAPYLPDVTLPETVDFTADLGHAARGAPVWVLAVPSFAMRALAEQLRPHCTDRTVVVNLAKGLESNSLKTMSQVLQDVLPPARVFTLSGPSHAEEVGLDYPTSVVIAGHDLQRGKSLQQLFMTERFRPYLSEDLLGVEYGGAIKNVIALAAGILDGLGFGDNAKGALIARGLAEMVRLGVKLGTQRETLFGLSGLGDLVTTCTSKHSRNRFVGEQLGKGRSLAEVLSQMKMVAEGVFATQTVATLARARKVDMPITHACHAVLYEGVSPLEKLSELMTRQLKLERI